MKHEPILETRFFFATTPLPCPYIEGRTERRVVMELVGRDAGVLHDQLSLAGFRRSHNIAYAPACPGCNDCHAVRIKVNEFSLSRSQRRVMARNQSLVARETPPNATEIQYALFSAYQKSRHADGDMANMDFSDYQSLIENTPVDTRVVEFHDPKMGLVAACLIDQIANGLSAVYSFFDPDLHRMSLGSYMILWMVEKAKRQQLDYVYLGFWIPGCAKMSYKSSFHPIETNTPEGWREVSPEES